MLRKRNVGDSGHLSFMWFYSFCSSSGSSWTRAATSKSATWFGPWRNQPCSFIIFVPIWMKLCIIIEALYPSDRPSLSRKIKVRKGLFCFNLWSAALHTTASTAYVPLLSTVCWKIWQNQFEHYDRKKGGGEATPLKPGIGIRLRKRLWTKLFIMSILITRHTRSHSFFMSVYRTCSKWVSRQHSTKK